MEMKNEALIIVDMSYDFVADDGGLTVGKPGQEIVPYIVSLADQFLESGGHVVIAMDAHEPNDPHFELWPVHNVVGTKGQELYGQLKDWYEANRQNERVHYVPKSNYNAFFKTGLGDKLRSLGVDTVHIVGVATDICDYLTVAGADAEGFKTKVHRRGVATFTDKGEIALEQMKANFHTEIIEE